MLTDIFAARYADVQIWQQFTQRESRLLVQAFRLVQEQIVPFYDPTGNERADGKAAWKRLHDQISMELGLKQLSEIYYSYQTTWNGAPHTMSGSWPLVTVCENWMLKPFSGQTSADEFIKDRLSLVELAFRHRGEHIAEANSKLKAEMLAADLRTSRRPGALTVPGKLSDGLKAFNDSINSAFKNSVDELNTRFRQSGVPLNYHNGFVQISADTKITDQIEKPFWELVAAPKWTNVDIDMKEAIDLRDGRGKDPAFPALKALESTIKIISSEKGWSNGREKGAHNYIDTLGSKANGFISQWEANALKQLFTEVRNALGHGAGEKEMPALNAQQTDWAIHYCMIWISSLIRRMY